LFIRHKIFKRVFFCSLGFCYIGVIYSGSLSFQVCLVQILTKNKIAVESTKNVVEQNFIKYIFEKKYKKRYFNSQAVALSTPPGSQWATRCPGLFMALFVRIKIFFCSIVIRKGLFFVFQKKNNQN